MRTKFLCAILMVGFLSGCETVKSNSKLVYGLDDKELHLLGHHLGFHVENLGMDDYKFTRGRGEFHVLSHTDIAITNRAQADGPVELRFYPAHPISLSAANRWNRDKECFGHIAVAVADRKESYFQANLLVNEGVTMNTVELYFRRFISEIDSFEHQLQNPE